MEGCNKPWEKFPYIWKTKASFLAALRSGLRNGLWKKHRVKLEFLKQRVVLVDNTNPRSMKRFPKVKMYTCDSCKGMFKSGEGEVDHKHGGNSLKEISDIQKFVEKLAVDVDLDSLQWLCKPCHAVKTLAERDGLSFEEAEIKKERIRVASLPTKELLAFLEEKGYTGASVSNKSKRDKLLVEIFGV